MKTLEVILKWLSADRLGKKEQTVKSMYDEFKDQTNNIKEAKNLDLSRKRVCMFTGVF